MKFTLDIELTSLYDITCIRTTYDSPNPRSVREDGAIKAFIKEELATQRENFETALRYTITDSEVENALKAFDAINDGK